MIEWRTRKVTGEPPGRMPIWFNVQNTKTEIKTTPGNIFDLPTGPNRLPIIPFGRATD